MTDTVQGVQDPVLPAMRRFWLMKSEPELYSIDDLARDGHTSWEGVRNYEARNFMRDQMRVGDGVLFYASNARPSGVTGIAEVKRVGYPDRSAWDRQSDYYDPKSTAAAPIWFMVDISFVARFPATVALETLRTTAGLEQMLVTRKGSRLSIQPVTCAEFERVLELGRERVATARG
jgi:predicted RNA-binding protein with PUA-like domain